MRKYTIIILLLGVIMLSCNKNEFNIQNINDNTITVLGHGGMGISHVYPMNSYESIMNCLSIGADGTEIDVQMTKDSVLVAFHHEYLEHSTNSSRQIYQRDWHEIQGAYYSGGAPYTYYRLITIDELFSHVDNKDDYTFFFDCKNFNPDSSSAYVNTFNSALIAVIDKHNLSENAYIELKREDIAKSLKARRPDLNIFIYNNFGTAINLVKKYNLQGIVISVDNISKEMVQEAHNNNIMVSVFNTHSKQRNIDAINKNVDFIQTDRLKHLIRLLK